MSLYLAMVYEIGNEVGKIRVFEADVLPDDMPDKLKELGTSERIAEQIGLSYDPATNDLVVFDIPEGVKKVVL